MWGNISVWDNITVNVGIIGNGVQSKRIQKILKKKNISFFIYKPSKKKNYFNKEEFEYLKKKKIIFILSPNKSHFDYIKTLSKNRYIFCEKPPVNNFNDLKQLKKISYKKIYFNFNNRFSKISEILHLKDEKYNLGKLIYSNIIITHGLALKKKDYKKSWRSNQISCPKGVFEVVSIHWIDLINYHFNIAKIRQPTLINHSKIGNSFDTSHIELKLKENGIVNIFTSYNAPLLKKNIFIFENGIIEMNESSIVIKGPSLNLDKNNFFKEPKIIKKFDVNEMKDYQLSLEKSCEYFLEIIAKKKFFKKLIFDSSLRSNSLII